MSRNVTTLQTILLASLFAVLGAGLLLVASLGALEDHVAVKSMLAELGALLVVAVALAALWELVGRRAFAREILETAGAGADVEAAGLVRLTTSYLTDPDWNGLFASVEKLDIFVAYARTWRAAHHGQLLAVAQRPGSRIRVYLPDPHDEPTIQLLADRFAMNPDDLRRLIEEARTEFQGMEQPGGGEVSVFYRRGDSVFSCYRFDRTAIMTMYSHTQGRANVPTVVCRDGGTLYDFIRKELAAIAEQSGLATGPVGGGGEAP